MIEILNVVIPVFLIIGLSYVVARYKKINLDPIIDLLIYFLAPALVFSAIQQHELVLSNFAKIAVSAISVCLIAGALALLIFKVFKINKRGLLLPMIFMNSGNIGYPISLFAFGTAGLSLAVKYDIFNAILVFSLGVYIAAQKANFKEIFKLPLIYAAVLGVLFAIFKVQVPTMIMRPIELVGMSSIPLQLIVLGISLREVDFNSLKLAFFGSVFRIGIGFILALVMVAILRPETLTKNVIVLEAAMPSALFSVILAHKYNRDAGLVASTVLISTVLSLFSISAILWFLAI